MCYVSVNFQLPAVLARPPTCSLFGLAYHVPQLPQHCFLPARQWSQQACVGHKGWRRQEPRGGEWRGLDPIIPITDSQILDSIVDFYGLADGFSVKDQVVRYIQGEWG